ncbi:hypothetical protein MHYP_G00284650 [Metynnis hypsauchen]
MKPLPSRSVSAPLGLGSESRVREQHVRGTGNGSAYCQQEPRDQREGPGVTYRHGDPSVTPHDPLRDPCPSWGGGVQSLKSIQLDFATAAPAATNSLRTRETFQPQNLLSYRSEQCSTWACSQGPEGSACC